MRGALWADGRDERETWSLAPDKCSALCAVSGKAQSHQRERAAGQTAVLHLHLDLGWPVSLQCSQCGGLPPQWGSETLAWLSGRPWAERNRTSRPGSREGSDMSQQHCSQNCCRHVLGLSFIQGLSENSSTLYSVDHENGGRTPICVYIGTGSPLPHSLESHLLQCGLQWASSKEHSPGERSLWKDC